MIRSALFVIVSAGIVGVSWRSLRVPRSHGFFRFFAFELLAALILLNVPVWFRDPFCARQLAAWFFLVSSAGLAIEGFRLLRKTGNPVEPAAGDAKLAFENTTTLVTTGLYRVIRHPLYASLLALGWGASLKRVSMVRVALALAATAFLFATSVVEERENLARFGSSYAAYLKTSQRFVPFLF